MHKQQEHVNSDKNLQKSYTHIKTGTLAVAISKFRLHSRNENEIKFHSHAFQTDRNTECRALDLNRTSFFSVSDDLTKTSTNEQAKY